MAERKIDERTTLKIVAPSRGVSKSKAYRLLPAEKSSKG